MIRWSSNKDKRRADIDENHFFAFSFIFHLCSASAAGIDRLFEEPYTHNIKNKRVGLITNHTGVDSNLTSNIKLLKNKAHLVAIFCPEHGIDGAGRADEKIAHSKDRDGIHIYSLHGETRRPTVEMLKDIDVLVNHIQEIGCRSYTYISTLFYAMEEAAKKGIPVVVLDRPNPMAVTLSMVPCSNRNGAPSWATSTSPIATA